MVGFVRRRAARVVQSGDLCTRKLCHLLVAQRQQDDAVHEKSIIESRSLFALDLDMLGKPLLGNLTHGRRVSFGLARALAFLRGVPVRLHLAQDAFGPGAPTQASMVPRAGRWCSGRSAHRDLARGGTSPHRPWRRSGAPAARSLSPAHPKGTTRARRALPSPRHFRKIDRRHMSGSRWWFADSTREPPEGKLAEHSGNSRKDLCSDFSNVGTTRKPQERAVRQFVMRGPGVQIPPAAPVVQIGVNFRWEGGNCRAAHLNVNNREDQP